MSDQNHDGTQRELQTIAGRHDVSLTAAKHLFDSLSAGHGVQAQFSHPELGGMGQWSRDGMLMIGDMFNHSLKAKVGALCQQLADLVSRDAGANTLSGQSQSQNQGSGSHSPGIQVTGNWWPADLGAPIATGAQNDMRYAFFSSTRRLVLSVDGKIKVYDTKDHMINGFSQQQSGHQSAVFTSQHGSVDLSQLEEVKTGHGAPCGAA